MAQQMNRYHYALLLMVVAIRPLDAQAPDDAIALAAVPELGRLFTTPEQRLQLERALRQPTLAVPPPLQEAAPAPIAIPASAARGSLRRADRLIRLWP